MKTPDRVTYSYGLKLQGPEDYSSINIHQVYATDVLDGETPEEAMVRARKFVQAQIEEDYDDCIKLRSDARASKKAKS